MKIIGKILAVILVIAAIYTFDRHNFNQVVMPLLLLSMAGQIFAENNEKLSKFFRRVSLALAIILILKRLLVG